MREYGQKVFLNLNMFFEYKIYVNEYMIHTFLKALSDHVFTNMASASLYDMPIRDYMLRNWKGHPHTMETGMFVLGSEGFIRL